jgi:lysozyme
MNIGPKEPLSPSEADLIMRRDDLPIIENIIRENVKVKLTQTQFDALVSLLINWNPALFLESEKLTLLNSGLYVETANHIRDKGPFTSGGIDLDSLHRRRAEEAEMFLKLVDIP